MESNYCGYIECYKGALTGRVYLTKIEDIRKLETFTSSYTVAIFKIKLKQKTNERY